jgi:hypothetical protein
VPGKLLLHINDMYLHPIYSVLYCERKQGAEDGMYDLFTQVQPDDFHWVVGLFAGSGATDAIRKANEVPLKTFYPIRFNGNGEPIPLWRPYLFIEHREDLTTMICRSTKKFIKILSMRDKWGQEYPVKVRKNAIDDHLTLLMSGRFNDRNYKRRRYGRGSIVRVVDGTFIDKRVRLLVDIEPDWPGTKKVAIDINGLRGSIELWKLSL